jgi:hypothetical protein
LRWPRRAGPRQVVTEHLARPRGGRLTLNLAYLRRRGLLEVGRYTTLTWSRGGQQTGSIALSAQPDGVRLRYQTKDREGLPVEANELVAFAFTPTRFGGHRQWLDA